MFTNDGYRKARIATLIAFLINGFSVGTFVSRIPDFKRTLAISNSLLGTSLLFATAGVFIAIRPASKIAAKFGSGPVTKYSAMTLCLGVPLVGLLFNLQWFWLSLFIYGSLSSVHDLSMNSQASALEHVGGKRVMSKFHAGWSLGGLAGGAIGGVAASAGLTPRLHLLLVGILILTVALLTKNWFLPANADQHVINKEAKKSKRPTKFLILGLLGLGGAIGEGAASEWGGVLARDTFHASPFVTALPYVFFSTMMVAGRISGDRIATKYGASKLLTWSGAIAGVGLALGLISNNIFGILVAWLLLGAGLATIIPMLVSASGKLANSEFVGVVSAAEGVALVTGVAYFGFVIGPPLIGFVADQTSLRWAMMIPAGLAILVSLTARKVITS